MAGLVGALVALLLFELFVVHRGAHAISIRDAGWSTAGFIPISVAFGISLGIREGPHIAGQFLAPTFSRSRCHWTTYSSGR